MLQTVALPLLLAFVVTWLLGPIVRRGAIAYGWYDRPDAGLKPHARPIPYLGGVAIYVGWLVPVLIWIVWQTNVRTPLAWVVLGGTALMLTGLVDDLRGLSPRLRLLIQVAVAGAMVYGGLGRGLSADLLGRWGEFLHGSSSGHVLAMVVDTGFCAFILAGATNSTNLIDGLDGLCGGVVGIAALGFGVAVLVLSPTEAGGQPTGAWAVVLCAAVLGSCLGYLRYNFHPASLFMGDSGSLLLGLNVAVLIIALAGRAGWRGLIVGLMVFGFPIFDTTLTIARRGLNKRPLLVGDRSHFYDQMRDRGLSVRRTVLVCYAMSAICAALAMVLTVVPMVYVLVVAVGVPVFAALACWRAGLLRVDDSAERSRQTPESPAP